LLGRSGAATDSDGVGQLEIVAVGDPELHDADKEDHDQGQHKGKLDKPLTAGVANTLTEPGNYRAKVCAGVGVSATGGSP
jgi:hypothetical protein